MTTTPNAVSVPARGARLPVGTLLVIAVSGVVLLAQSLGLFGAREAQWVLAPDHLAIPGILTYAFFHTDVLHWAVNMALLLAVAPRLERTIGTTVTLLVFLLGAVVAGLVHVSVVTLFVQGDAARPLMGASGGIMALLGVYSVRFYGRRIAPSLPRRDASGAAAPRRGFPFSIPLGWALFAWLLTEGIFGWRDAISGTGAVAHWAHVGGFLAGMSFAVLAGQHSLGRREEAVAGPSTDEQRERLSGYLRDHPDDAPSRLLYAQALLHIGEREEAAAAYCRAVEQFLQHGRKREAAEAWLALRGARLTPPATGITLRAARALEDTGYREEALAVYDGLTAAPGPESESAALRAAQLAERLGQPEEARLRYQAFLLMHPGSQFVSQARRSLDRLLSRV
jgi:membrane associated rhomboid family serine protease